ncbi:hypothetical protein UAJ10_02140 [Nitrospirillum sp. BR 11164]|uniref:hypothetical protein n=1 Tax=Nitrospirillum sp. BR 11164 TaxID=3104324 RepID=UPI002AFDF829|nr:hypothetical protein [Nitrospirillum sp. BR 11164]MEA1647819.1 hypothetical protein [Nitrospirillum sp. BR 11164]
MKPNEEISGRLHRLGNSVLDDNSRLYSMVELAAVGNSAPIIMTNLHVPAALDVYLRECLGEEATIWVTKTGNGHSLIGVRLPSGKIYYTVPGTSGLVAAVIICAVGCLFFFIGLVLLPSIFAVAAANRIGAELASRGGVQI